MKTDTSQIATMLQSAHSAPKIDQVIDDRRWVDLQFM